uniref:Protein Nef n=1 Tax=Human immunodeficiency virus type 1 TaxID=11676 RepID=T1PT22_HV1|nr:nef protein [Human immunodeficiency virus 1]
MGGKWSKSCLVGWPQVRDRIRQTPPAAEGVGAVSQDLDKHGEVLMWKFDSALARKHIAREMHPEFYKDC